MQKFLKLQNDSKKPWKRKPVCAPVQAHEVYSRGISKSRAKASFVICTWALNLSGPTKGKLLNAALPIVVRGWETGSQRRWRRDASEMQRSSRTWDGWRGGEEGREERSWMDAWIPKLSGEKADQEAEVGTTSMQKRKVKRNHDWSSCCSSPLPLGRQSQGCSHLPLPSPEGCSPRTASELQERRDESPGLQGNPSPQRTWAGL